MHNSDKDGWESDKREVLTMLHFKLASKIHETVGVVHASLQHSSSTSLFHIQHIFPISNVLVPCDLTVVC